MLAHFAISNIDHNPPKSRNVVFKIVFSVFMGLQIQIKMSFMGLKIGLSGFEKVFKIFLQFFFLYQLK